MMLVRDTGLDTGLSVFLMRRHAAMDFAAGVMVFPAAASTTGTATPTWAGWGLGRPAAVVVGPALRHPTRSG
ncbi:hypothetical protein I551_2996 [Mycobacterium ulcerans str. Harvey]|uniref:Uncharacterized protein n=1 Tax=Mycobacterium ulcerans str. Harvey TaxID=1299332 RepID=A0ABN0R0N3_MYCUL|nr:hypothetical protein I551_2996 [Mycobacterium ulcerans str. Harvey]